MGLFNQNGGFVRFMNRAFDVIWLNVLWLVFSIPLITIGASTCAAFSVTLKMVDDEEGYVGRMFVKAFKENFKQGTIFWLFLAPCIYALYLIWQVVVKADDISFLVILGAILFTALVIVFSIYTFPLIARYENTLKNHVKNSCGITIQYFGRTVFMVAVVALEVLIIMWNKWTLMAGVLIGPEFIIYTISGISKRIFQKLEKNQKPAESPSSIQNQSGVVENAAPVGEETSTGEGTRTGEGTSTGEDNPDSKKE